MDNEIYIQKFFNSDGNIVEIKYYSDKERETLINLKKIETYSYVLDESTQEVVEKTIVTDYYKGDEIVKSETIKEYITK